LRNVKEDLRRSRYGLRKVEEGMDGTAQIGRSKNIEKVEEGQIKSRKGSWNVEKEVKRM
jgi:hypothetical protein